MMWLTSDFHPDQNRITLFRKHHLPVLSILLLQIAHATGLLKLGISRLDEANAGKHKQGELL